MTNRTIRLGKGLRQLDISLGQGMVRVTRIGDHEGAEAGASPLWTLSVIGPDGVRVELSADEAEVVSIGRFATSATFTWTVPINGTDSVGKVIMAVDAESEQSSWVLSATLPGGWKVAEAVFPSVALSRGEGMKLAVPTSWGLEKEIEPGFHWDAIYPSWGATMQFVAAYGAGSGLYFGTHDPKANHKEFRADADEAGITLSCRHFPAISEGDFTLQYKVVIGAYEGSYMEAATIYREFALTAPWTQAGPLSKRSVPKWLLDTELWLKPGDTPWTEDDAECIAVTKANVERCRQAKAYFDVPISLHWYRWHKIPYDTLYPEYFPAKAGFLDGVKEAQEAGFHVMPYINGRLCDPESETWKQGATKWAARDEKGEPYTEEYGSKVPLNVMCPATPYWQDTVGGLVKRLVDEIRVDGVYIDQIACAKAERCFDAGHPHAAGGGTFWVDGCRTLLESARKNLPAGGILTSEECIECWMDLLDAHLILNSPCGEGEMIPLFPAVYTGYTVAFGYQYFPQTEGVHSLGFRAKMARGFLWGTQLGWIDSEKLMAEGGDTDREFLRNLCHVRQGAHDFLLYGEFLGPVEVTGDNPRFTQEAPGSFGGTYTLDVPAVMATEWEAEDGRTATAVCNLDDAPHTVSVCLVDGPVELTLEPREARVITA